MASYQALMDDVCSWMNRTDIIPRIPGFVLLVETEIAETLRSRCQVTVKKQAIDADEVSLPTDFATMESIRDANTGELLVLKDEWTGHWDARPGEPILAYRLVHNCIEFLPHPVIPDPPDPSYVFQQVQMAYYQRPSPPLVLPTDTNAILDNLYGVYLFGVLKQAAAYERDAPLQQLADQKWQEAVTRGNLWKQQSDYSGAPFVAEMAVVF